MLETSRVWRAIFGVLAASCATPAPPVGALAAPETAQAVARRASDDLALAQAAKAMLAQAETDVQRARAKRSLWLKAWEDLLAARRALGAQDHAAVLRYAREASELAQLGLEQLSYPAVK